MKKTVNINLAGMSLTIDEDAYERLKRYLDEIAVHFSSSVDKKEIVDDIERAIAEHMVEKKSVSKEVMTLADIETIITEMGTIRDFQSADEIPKTEPAQDEAGEPKKTKRFFRNTEEQTVGGVCAGLAAYFGIDVTFVRAFFVIATLFWGWGILLYIILWVVMPEAKTLSDKAAMTGEPLTISKIEEKIRATVGEDRDRKAAAEKFVVAPLRFLGTFFTALITGVKKIIPVIGRIMGILVIIVTTIAIAGLTTFATVVALLQDIPHHEIGLSTILSPALLYAGVGALYLLIVIPLLFILLIGVSWARMKSVIRLSFSMAALAIWVLAFGLVGALAITHEGEINKHIETYRAAQAAKNTTVNLPLPNEPFTAVILGGGHRLLIERGDVASVKATGRPETLERLVPVVEDGTLLVRQRLPEFCIFFCPRSTATIVITVPSLTKATVHGAVEAEIHGFTKDVLPERVELMIDASGAARVLFTGETDRLAVWQSGASRVTLQGTAQETSVNLSGASPLMAEEWRTLRARVEATGGSRVTVNAVDELWVTGSGAARIFYAGEPAIIAQELSGAARLEQIADPFMMRDQDDPIFFE